jgi:RNA polymerase sigma factor (sigma-70 family)
MNDASRQRFERLVRDYSRLVQSVSRRVAGRADLADDVEQRVFLKIWRRFLSEQEIHHPSSYIYRAAVHETITLIEQETRRASGDEDEGLGAVAAGPFTDPAEDLEGKQIAATVDEVLATLTVERRQAVQSHLAGFDVREIMKLRSWSYNKARNLIVRGMADLRRGLIERGVHV